MDFIVKKKKKIVQNMLTATYIHDIILSML